MEKEIEKAIFKTLVYADIFDYPLKVGEIEKYLIADNFHLGGVPSAHHPRCSQEECEIGLALDKLVKEEKIGKKGEYYFLNGRGKIVELREKRKKWSLAKIRKAERIANLLKIIPTVRLVGISGALAMENSDWNDDIDLFIVTASGRLWLTRLLMTILVELTGQRRRPMASLANSKILESSHSLLPRMTSFWHFDFAQCLEPVERLVQNLFRHPNLKDKICLNMFIDEDHLAVPQDEQNLFTAHEVVQMRPIWERDDTYQKFLWGNRWVKEYLPNSMENEKLKIGKDTIRGGSYKQMKAPDFLGIIEKLACWVQLKYMARRRTTEKIENGRVMFHPLDKSDWVMKNYTQGVVSITP